MEEGGEHSQNEMTKIPSGGPPPVTNNMQTTGTTKPEPSGTNGEVGAETSSVSQPPSISQEENKSSKNPGTTPTGPPPSLPMLPEKGGSKSGPSDWTPSGSKGKKGMPDQRQNLWGNQNEWADTPNRGKSANKNGPTGSGRTNSFHESQERQTSYNNKEGNNMSRASSKTGGYNHKGYDNKGYEKSSGYHNNWSDNRNSDWSKGNWNEKNWNEKDGGGSWNNKGGGKSWNDKNKGNRKSGGKNKDVSNGGYGQGGYFDNERQYSNSNAMTGTPQVSAVNNPNPNMMGPTSTQHPGQNMAGPANNMMQPNNMQQKGSTNASTTYVAPQHPQTQPPQNNQAFSMFNNMEGGPPHNNMPGGPPQNMGGGLSNGQQQTHNNILPNHPPPQQGGGGMFQSTEQGGATAGGMFQYGGPTAGGQQQAGVVQSAGPSGPQQSTGPPPLNPPNGVTSQQPNHFTTTPNLPPPGPPSTTSTGYVPPQHMPPQNNPPNTQQNPNPGNFYNNPPAPGPSVAGDSQYSTAGTALNTALTNNTNNGALTHEEQQAQFVQTAQQQHNLWNMFGQIFKQWPEEHQRIFQGMTPDHQWAIVRSCVDKVVQQQQMAFGGGGGAPGAGQLGQYGRPYEQYGASNQYGTQYGSQYGAGGASGEYGGSNQWPNHYHPASAGAAMFTPNADSGGDNRCRYFRRVNMGMNNTLTAGCWRGNKCRFFHNDPSNEEQAVYKNIIRDPEKFVQDSKLDASSLTVYENDEEKYPAEDGVKLLYQRQAIGVNVVDNRENKGETEAVVGQQSTGPSTVVKDAQGTLSAAPVALVPVLPPSMPEATTAATSSENN